MDTPGGDDMMRYLSGGGTYPWKTMITLNLTEIKNHAEVGTIIAKGFTKFCLDEKHNHPEKFVFLNSLTPMDGRDRPLNNGLRGTVVSHQVFIHSQSLIAR